MANKIQYDHIHPPRAERGAAARRNAKVDVARFAQPSQKLPIIVASMSAAVMAWAAIQLLFH